MKAYTKAVLIGAIVLTVGITATCAASSGIKSVSYNQNKVMVDGKLLDISSQPMLSLVKEGETDASNYMPVRSVLEGMGYNVEWDGSTNTVVVTSKTSGTKPAESVEQEQPAQTEQPQQEPPAQQQPQQEQPPQQEPQAPLETKKLSGIIITIDAGHQAKGNSEHEKVAPNSTETKPKVASGTKGVATGIPEYELTLKVSMKLKQLLQDEGATVYMVRESNDVNISNAERAVFANNNNSDVSVRIHADGAPSSSARGFSVLIPGNDYIKNEQLVATSREIGAAVQKHMAASTGAQDRGLVIRNDLTGFNWTTVPAVLVEMGFMTNPVEDKLMSTDDYQNKIARGIADGLIEYYGK